VRALSPLPAEQIIEEHFDSISGEEDWIPRYNIAPTQPVPIICQHPKEPRREMSLVRWGLIPSWAKDASGSAQMINARSETAAAKPAFRDAVGQSQVPCPGRRILRMAADGQSETAILF
jgi:putative SOS response-associated peptidase YedK